MKDKLSARDIATIGISVALIFSIGMIVVVGLSALIAFPSAMVVFATPLLTMVFVVACLRTRKIGTVSLICTVFGLIMLRITPLGVAAIGSGAVLSDLVTRLIFKTYKTNKKVILSTPLMCSFGVWTAYIIMGIFTVEETIYTSGGFLATLLVSIFVYGLGYFIARLTERVFSKRVAWAKEPKGSLV